MDNAKLIIDSWPLILASIGIIIISIQRIIEFISLPTERQLEEVQSRLLEWVRNAEAELGSGTGKFKLSLVYNRFCQEYPKLKKWFTIEKFDKLVGEALEAMKDEFTRSETAKKNALGGRTEV